MPAKPDGFVEETLWLREETQRLIDISRAERRMCDAMMEQFFAVFPRLLPWDDDASDRLPRQRSG